MPTYSDLTLNKHYLVIENEGENIVLIQPLMETETCVLVLHHDDYETTFWRKKDDFLFEMIEELTEEQVEAYEDLYEDEETDWLEED